MKVKKTALSTLFIIVFGVLLVACSTPGARQSSHSTFTLGPPGVALEQPDKLLVAVQLNNTSHKAAFKVKINSIQLDSAPLLTPIPIAVGEIGAGRSAIVQANFNSGPLTPGKQYQLVMHGSYHAAEKGKDKGYELKSKGHEALEHQKFVVRRVIVLPPTAPGSASVNTSGAIPPNKVTGAPFPPQPLQFEDDDVNQAAPPVPTASFVPGTPTPTSTGVMPAPLGDPPAIVLSGSFRALAIVSLQPAPQTSSAVAVRPGPIGISRRRFSGNQRAPASIIPICRWETTNST